METEVKIPSFNQEKTPIKPEKIRFDQPEKRSEFDAQKEQAGEKYEQVSELQASAGDLSSISTLPIIQTTDDNTSSATDSTSNNMPSLAEDDDLIEKEWVDRAKKIIADTKNDPHERDDQVGKMQVEYIEKRFGREIGVVDEE